MFVNPYVGLFFHSRREAMPTIFLLKQDGLDIRPAVFLIGVLKNFNHLGKFLIFRKRLPLTPLMGIL